jgi:hypothetical protein
MLLEEATRGSGDRALTNARILGFLCPRPGVILYRSSTLKQWLGHSTSTMNGAFQQDQWVIVQYGAVPELEALFSLLLGQKLSQERKRWTIRVQAGWHSLIPRAGERTPGVGYAPVVAQGTPPGAGYALSEAEGTPPLRGYPLFGAEEMPLLESEAIFLGPDLSPDFDPSIGLSDPWWRFQERNVNRH